jgi:hypothetical protein
MDAADSIGEVCSMVCAKHQANRQWDHRVDELFKFLSRVCCAPPHVPARIKHRLCTPQAPVLYTETPLGRVQNTKTCFVDQSTSAAVSGTQQRLMNVFVLQILEPNETHREARKRALFNISLVLEGEEVTFAVSNKAYNAGIDIQVRACMDIPPCAARLYETEPSTRSHCFPTHLTRRLVRAEMDYRPAPSRQLTFSVSVLLSMRVGFRIGALPYSDYVPPFTLHGNSF